MGANLPDEATGPEGPLIPSSGCHPAGGSFVTVPLHFKKCPQSVTKLWQFPHFSGTYVTSTRRKSLSCKRGRRDSNPQPPDRQLGAANRIERKSPPQVIRISGFMARQRSRVGHELSTF